MPWPDHDAEVGGRGQATTMPLAELVGVRTTVETSDEVVCELTVLPEHLNQGLIAHGGTLFTLADTALGILANPTSSEGWVGTTFTLQLFKAVRIGDLVRARAVAEQRSRSVQFLRAELERSDGVRLGTLSAQLQRAQPRPAPALEPVSVRLVEVGPDGPLASALRRLRHQESGPGPDAAGTPVVRVAMTATDVLGFVLSTGDTVLDVWVHPRWRGQGVGRMLSAAQSPRSGGSA